MKALKDWTLFGFTDVADFTHVMETLLDEMRDNRREVTPDSVDVLLCSVDVLREMLRATSAGNQMDPNKIKAQKAQLDQLLRQEVVVIHSDRAKTSDETPPLGWHIVFRPHAHLMSTGNDPLRFLYELSSMGDLVVDADIDALPDLPDLQPEDCCLNWDLRITGNITREEIDDVFAWIEDDCDLSIMPILSEQTESSASLQAPVSLAVEPTKIKAVPAPDDRRIGDRREGAEQRQDERRTPKSGASNSIRVDIDKIDVLINMVGELVITQSMLSMLGEEFDMSRVERLQEGLSQLERHTREMQESVMQIRMLPISSTFSRFPRLVHDLSIKMSKKIELKMSGENTEVDKTVIEKISDPLVHLVRNSLDHGIELPEERIAAGKPETGTVELNASHRGGNILIEVKDDGKGLNRELLLKKGIERGVVSADANLTDQQVFELIFIAGFSTNNEVSDISGRGVGMDVVRRNINELGGHIEIKSEVGKESSFIIRLPLTLAILDGQTISVGTETYIIPLASIIESIQIKEEMINLVAGRGETFKLREEYLPVVRLHQVLGVDNAKATNLSEGLLVVVEGEGRRCGLFVDDLLGQQQVVIKSLEANYRKLEGISGATILGDGSVALILDIAGLIRLVGRIPSEQNSRLSA